MRCPHCNGDDTTQIAIHLRAEDTVQFFSCRRCEYRWWIREGDLIELDEVLQLAGRRDQL
jgi:Zn ribbon nucleic-acid-binding protein